MKSILWIFVLMVSLAAAGCRSSDATSQAQPEAKASLDQNDEYVAPDARGVQTVTVRATAIPEYLDLAAHIEPDPGRVVRVYSPAGGRVVEMKVRPGDRVEKGQLLAIIESSDLSRAVSDYRKALADSEVKQKALARAQELLEHGAISERDFQQAQADSKSSQADVAATREQILVFGMDPDAATSELRVAAPRPGVILDIGAAPGEYSNALSAPAPLATVADISTVWAVGDIYEKDLSAAKPGQRAQVTLNAFPNRQWTGRVSVVSDAVDPTTRTLHVRVVLPNTLLPGGDPVIKPSMFGSIRILRSSEQGILVPSSAVIREGNNAYVFVGKGNGRFERRSVQVGRPVDVSLEIVAGVKAGDTIVSEGGLLLRSAGQD
jgi:cobalt-zinc-cadmium efflux system membrane fusion protein